ncbi:hypothetical protein KQH55_09035, partial [Mycetohabitans sp. B3]|nr:hypothetical protein [Mycetohabitans sp. B3]
MVVKKQLTKEPIIGVLKEGEAGLKPAELCRKHGMLRSDVLRLAESICLLQFSPYRFSFPALLHQPGRIVQVQLL